MVAGSASLGVEIPHGQQQSRPQ